ncbi:MAG: hypothetical protein GX295_07115 [Syntrophomonadaceae bacterium]|nr:hypothetical protein [Syntrophomonadaceae bacterium]
MNKPKSKMGATIATAIATAMVFFLIFAIGSPRAFAQGSNQEENTLERTRTIDLVANNVIKTQSFDDIDDIDDGWNDGDLYPEKGTKYIITKDLSKQTAEQLVQQIMGEGVQIVNVRYTGTDVAAGSFTAADGNIIGFNEGVILSTGNIRYADGPNAEGNMTHVNDLAGDEHLNLLVPGYETNDATILEFDFIPSENTLSFDYVFSSDEYNEYVGTEFNDVFGFFLNGKNIALIPNTDFPVAINNINNDLHNQYYRDNEFGGQIMTEMDGLTTVLTVTAPVKVGQMNTIRMAIADAGDYIFDSNVFIKGASFMSVESGVLQFSKLTQEVKENDGTAMITVTRTGNMQETVTVEYYTLDGSAKAPNEYLETKGTLVFEPGVTSMTIPVTIVDNDAAGDIKTLYVYLRNVTGNAIIGDNIRTRVLIMDDDTIGSQVQTVLWEEKTNVATNKNYIINFSTEIDPETVTSNNFYVQDETGQIVEDIKPELTFNKLSVIMKADGVFYYQPGQTYTLFISSKVKSLTGSPLGKQIKMNFTIKDLQ